MIEFFLCSLVTIFPDYLFRRYVQDKRIGREINFFSVWYELRWGITACLILTITLITIIFYYHPTTKNVNSFFRTVTILPETGGRVADVHVRNNQIVSAGDPIFSLDNSAQVAAAETARRQSAEVDAELEVAAFDLEAARATVGQAEAALKQVEEELGRKQELARRGSAAVSASEVDRLENLLASRQASLDAAQSAQQALETRIGAQLPARKATAEAALEQALTELGKMDVYAGVDGTIEQFTLRPGDFVSPVLRPAGILVPSDAGRFVAGFDQITTQVLKPGMLMEMTCISKPFTIIPMVATEIQNVIATGQLRPSDQLTDAQDRTRPGTITVFMEPLYEGQTAGIPPGSTCIANAYTNNHAVLAEGGLPVSRWLFLHMVDATAVVHAIILRIQALVLPVQTLVFSGH